MSNTQIIFPNGDKNPSKLSSKIRDSSSCRSSYKQSKFRTKNSTFYSGSKDTYPFIKSSKHSAPKIKIENHESNRRNRRYERVGRTQFYESIPKIFRISGTNHLHNHTTTCQCYKLQLYQLYFGGSPISISQMICL